MPKESAMSTDKIKNNEPKNFALIGAAGYIAHRHMKAIKDTDNQLIAAVDPHDSVGLMDNYFLNARFFTEIERFDRHLEKLKRASADKHVNYVSICSPNYLHDSHIRLALRVGADAICEKPLVINPWNLDALEEIEHETNSRVWSILQLRLHPAVQEFRKRVLGEPNRQWDVVLTYVTRRGAWYFHSWKGQEEKSGGLAMNIGVHFFDLLIWLFGEVQENCVFLRNEDRMAGLLRLERAKARWFLSVNKNDLPAETQKQGKYAYRSLTTDGEEVDFSTGFTDLHTEVYKQTIAGNGFSISDNRASIKTVYDIRTGEVCSPASPNDLHPFLKNR